MDRVGWGQALAMAGRGLLLAIPALLRPAELQALNRRHYAEAGSFWGEAATIDWGLRPEEERQLAGQIGGGERVLVLFAGGGREALALAARGCRVTAVEADPALAAAGAAHARQRGRAVDFVIAEAGRLPPSLRGFDRVVIFSYMLGTVPSREERQRFLRESVTARLAAGGRLLGDVYLRRPTAWHRRLARGQRLLARLCAGNPGLQVNDTMLGPREFYHFFRGRGEVAGELSAAGLRLQGWAIEGDVGQFVAGL